MFAWLGVRNGSPKESGWEGAKISPHGVVKTRRFMPYAPAKSRNEAEANSAFHQTFLKAMPPDPETAEQTGVPVNVERQAFCPPR
jgi:hypothetical protein